MKITIDIPDSLITHLENEAQEADMNLEDWLVFLIEKSWIN